MDMIYEIRRRYHIQEQSISKIAREMGLSRPTVRKHLQTLEEPKYNRAKPVSPNLGPFQEVLEQWLEEETQLPRSRRRTGQRMYECLREQGYQGAYDSIQRFIKQWKNLHQGPKITQAFVQWDLPKPIQRVREHLLKQPKGDRDFVELLIAAGEAGLEALTVACELALEYGAVNAPVILNELRRLISPDRPASIQLVERIALSVEPLADCERYDHLRGACHVH